jgi:hypothetical protein
MTLIMRFIVHFALVALLASFGMPAMAQQAVVEPTEIQESGEDYLRSIRVRRIDADVSYFDPSAPPPELTTRQEPEPAPDNEGRRIEIDLPSALISTAILIGIIYAFFRFGGGISVSLRSDAENARRDRVGAVSLLDDDGTPIELKGILGLKDRRIALILLAQKALSVAVAANGVLFQRSWTARDALRRVQGQPDQVAALKALVLDSERVQFGGRDISEEDFQAHLANVRPLIEGATA